MSNLSQAVESFTKVTLAQAYKMMSKCVSKKIVPLIKSSPGIGKSAIAAKYAKEHNLFMIDLRLTQCDTTDLNGFPFMDHATGLARYYPMDTFPIGSAKLPTELRIDSETGKEKVHTYDGWLLFLDEITSASQSVQAAAYKLILDRSVGQHKLHDKVSIVAAGNLETDNAIVEPMSTALMSRMVHIYVQVSHKEWCTWAADNGVDARILAYLSWKPAHLYSFNADVTHDTYACPRTWEFASRLIEDSSSNIANLIDAETAVLLQGTVGKPIGVEFNSFLRIFNSLPSLDNIYSNPLTANVPSAPDIQYALSTALAQHLSPQNAVSTLQFLQRLPPEMQVICARTGLRSKTEQERNAISELPQFKIWLKEIIKLIF